MTDLITLTGPLVDHQGVTPLAGVTVTATPSRDITRTSDGRRVLPQSQVGNPLMHALIRDGQIIEAGPLPLPAWYDGTRWWDTRDPDQRTLAGWVEVVEEPRPADTATTTYDRTAPALVDGVPTVTWTARPKTPEELAADQAAATYQALTDVTTLDARLDRLAAYKTDTDLTAVLNQTNNQALPTATLNRALKTLVRENQRQSATVALLVRLLDPALLASITDTTDA